MTARRPADLFELLCCQAAGQPIPGPPAIPGRRFNAPEDAFEDPEQLRLQELTAQDVAAIAQISRQAAHRRIAVALETDDWSTLLAPQRQGRRPRAAATVAESPTANSRAAQGLQGHRPRDPPASPPHTNQPGEVAPGFRTSALTT